MAEQSHVVTVPLRRLGRWLSGFADRHGAWSQSRQEDPGGWQLTAADQSTAFVAEPDWSVHLGDRTSVADLRGLATAAPRFGVLLLRRAGYAVAVFDGTQVVDRKVGTRHIHGRTAAGGWSQQRYARRRANQGDEIVHAAVEHTERILKGAPGVRFLVTGGDRPLLAAARRSAGPVTSGLPVAAHLSVGTPDAAVLAGAPDRVLAVQITVTETCSDDPREVPERSEGQG